MQETEKTLNEDATGPAHDADAENVQIHTHRQKLSGGISLLTSEGFYCEGAGETFNDCDINRV